MSNSRKEAKKGLKKEAKETLIKLLQKLITEPQYLRATRIKKK